MKVETTDISGKWKEYTLVNEQGMSVSVINFGGIITEMLVPNRIGKLENVVIGFKNYADYETNPNYFGALIGRVAGRILIWHFICHSAVPGSRRIQLANMSIAVECLNRNPTQETLLVGCVPYGGIAIVDIVPVVHGRPIVHADTRILVVGVV